MGWFEEKGAKVAMGEFGQRRRSVSLSLGAGTPAAGSHSQPALPDGTSGRLPQQGPWAAQQGRMGAATNHPARVEQQQATHRRPWYAVHNRRLNLQRRTDVVSPQLCAGVRPLSSEPAQQPFAAPRRPRHVPIQSEAKFWWRFRSSRSHAKSAAAAYQLAGLGGPALYIMFNMTCYTSMILDRFTRHWWWTFFSLDGVRTSPCSVQSIPDIMAGRSKRPSSPSPAAAAAPPSCASGSSISCCSCAALRPCS